MSNPLSISMLLNDPEKEEGGVKKRPRYQEVEGAYPVAESHLPWSTTLDNALFPLPSVAQDDRLILPPPCPASSYLLPQTQLHRAPLLRQTTSYPPPYTLHDVPIPAAREIQDMSISRSWSLRPSSSSSSSASSSSSSYTRYSYPIPLKPYQALYTTHQPSHHDLTMPLIPRVPIYRYEGVPFHYISHTIQRKRRRSRACLYCHTKKVRCEGEKPRCVNCINNNIECKWVQTKRQKTKTKQKDAD